MPDDKDPDKGKRRPNLSSFLTGNTSGDSGKGLPFDPTRTESRSGSEEIAFEDSDLQILPLDWEAEITVRRDPDLPPYEPVVPFDAGVEPSPSWALDKPQDWGGTKPSHLEYEIDMELTRFNAGRTTDRLHEKDISILLALPGVLGTRFDLRGTDFESNTDDKIIGTYKAVLEDFEAGLRKTERTYDEWADEFRLAYSLIKETEHAGRVVYAGNRRSNDQYVSNSIKRSILDRAVELTGKAVIDPENQAEALTALPGILASAIKIASGRETYVRGLDFDSSFIPSIEKLLGYSETAIERGNYALAREVLSAVSDCSRPYFREDERLRTVVREWWTDRKWGKRLNNLAKQVVNKELKQLEQSVDTDYKAAVVGSYSLQAFAAALKLKKPSEKRAEALRKRAYESAMHRVLSYTGQFRDDDASTEIIYHLANRCALKAGIQLPAEFSGLREKYGSRSSLLRWSESAGTHVLPEEKDYVRMLLEARDNVFGNWQWHLNDSLELTEGHLIGEFSGLLPLQPHLADVIYEEVQHRAYKSGRHYHLWGGTRDAVAQWNLVLAREFFADGRYALASAVLDYIEEQFEHNKPETPHGVQELKDKLGTVQYDGMEPEGGSPGESRPSLAIGEEELDGMLSATEGDTEGRDEPAPRPAPRRPAPEPAQVMPSAPATKEEKLAYRVRTTTLRADLVEILYVNKRKALSVFEDVRLGRSARELASFAMEKNTPPPQGGDSSFYAALIAEHIANMNPTKKGVRGEGRYDSFGFVRMSDWTAIEGLAGVVAEAAINSATYQGKTYDELLPILRQETIRAKVVAALINHKADLKPITKYSRRHLAARLAKYAASLDPKDPGFVPKVVKKLCAKYALKPGTNEKQFKQSLTPLAEKIHDYAAATK